MSTPPPHKNNKNYRPNLLVATFGHEQAERVVILNKPRETACFFRTAVVAVGAPAATEVGVELQCILLPLLQGKSSIY